MDLRRLIVVIAVVAAACDRKEPAQRTESSARAAGSAAPAAAPAAAPRVEPQPVASEEPVLVQMPPQAPPPEQRPDASDAKAIRAVFDGYGFPLAAYVEPLCARRVGRGDAIVTWDAFVSELAPAELVAAFKKRLGDSGFSASAKGGGTWRLPAGSPTPSRTLVVFSPGEHGPHDACPIKPGKGAKSILLLTREE